MNDAGHPDAAQLAAYLERRLPASDRERVAAHLTECGECRGDLADVSRVQARAGRPARIATLVGLAAAAALAVVVLVPRSARRGPEPVVERGLPSARGLDVRSASRPGSGTPGGLLAWAPAGEGSTYHVSVADASGTELWSTSTSDTIVRLPATLVLAPAATYYWRTDALRPDGATSTTGAQELPAAH
jgi:anti-sigma factor RsiW